MRWTGALRLHDAHSPRHRRNLEATQMETPFACSRQLNSFMYDFDRLNRHLVGGGIETGPDPLRWPAIDEVPADFFLTRLVHQDDGAVLAFGLAIDNFLPPFPKIFIIGFSHLQADIGVLRLPRQSAIGVHLLVAFAVIDGIGGCIQTRTLTESVSVDPVDFELEVIPTIRIFSFSSWHSAPSLPMSFVLVASGLRYSRH